MILNCNLYRIVVKTCIAVFFVKLLKFIFSYISIEDRDVVLHSTYEIDYLDYDWIENNVKSILNTDKGRS